MISFTATRAIHTLSSNCKSIRRTIDSRGVSVCDSSLWPEQEYHDFDVPPVYLIGLMDIEIGHPDKDFWKDRYVSKYTFSENESHDLPLLDAVRRHLPPQGLNSGSCETLERKGSVRSVGRSRNTQSRLPFRQGSDSPRSPTASVLKLLKAPQCPFNHRPLPVFLFFFFLNPCSRYETQVTDVSVR